MFRKISLLFALLLSVVVWAGPISKEQAIKEAQAFLNSRRNMPHTAKMRQAYRAPKLMSASEQSYFYVFNVGDNNGFVIVSGDDRAPAILGYSAEGSIDTARLPENLKDLFDSYEQQIAVLSTMPDIPYTQKMKHALPNLRNIPSVRWYPADGIRDCLITIKLPW